MIPKKITITSEDSGMRLDVLCAQKFPEISRTSWQRQGKFVLDGKEKPAKTRVREGDTWEVSYDGSEMMSSQLQPWDFPLKILAESDSWVVIEKSEGISVHPSVSEKSDQTIVNALMHHFGKNLAENFDEIEGQKIPRPGLVHRLDKVTSGVLLVAKTNAAHRYFQEHWGEVEKEYIAVVEGRPPKKGKVEGGIIRDFKDRQKMTTSHSEKAKDAETFFEVLGSDDKFSILKVIIPTGRTHQIRVHLSEIGFPILGDTKYGGQKAKRVFLHAQKLTFSDPDQKGKAVAVDSEVPKIFSDLTSQRPSI